MSKFARNRGLSLVFNIIFLVLANIAQAEALVSGDGDIQAVRDQFHIPIFTVAEFFDWLQAR